MKTRERPLTQRTLSVVLLVVAMVVAIGETSSATARPGVLTATKFQTAMLALRDMPSGWSGGPLDLFDLPNTSVPGVCNNLATAPRTYGVVTVAAVEYSPNPSVGSYIEEVGYAFPTIASAQRLVSATRRAVSQCRAGWTTTNTNAQGSTVVIKWSVRAQPVKEIGDQTVAFRTTSTSDTSGQSEPLGPSDAVYVRKANYVLAISRGGPDVSAAAAIPDGRLLAFAKLALDRLTRSLVR
jgi:hypothetical protein